MSSRSTLLDAGQTLGQLGPWALASIGAMVFIESGVLFPFLPGDSLLVIAADLHTQLQVALCAIILVASVAAVLGDQVGFYLGHRSGRKLFNDDAKILRTERLTTAQEFFARRGPLALVLGRFVPIVRTYVPVASGTAGMSYWSVVDWNVADAIAWVVSMALVGALLGQIPGITTSIDGIMILIVFISVAPILFSAARTWWQQRKAAA